MKYRQPEKKLLKVKMISVNRIYYEIKIYRIYCFIPLLKDWIVAYTTLKDFKEDGEDNLHWCTYHKGKVFGVDTNHYHNQEQSIEEREKDAMIQIRRMILDYQERIGMIKK